MEITHITFQGPELSDPEILNGVPPFLRAILNSVNGYIQFGGGLHVRGACSEPSWHSLRRAWRGPAAFHNLYDSVSADWLPFAEDCVGDQFFLDGEQVLRLFAETGDVERTDTTLSQFFETVEKDPIEFLSLHPLLSFQQGNGELEVGKLIHAYPPFCTSEASEGVSLRAVPALELQRFHAELAKKLPGDGEKVEVKIVS